MHWQQVCAILKFYSVVDKHWNKFLSDKIILCQIQRNFRCGIATFMKNFVTPLNINDKLDSSYASFMQRMNTTIELHINKNDLMKVSGHYKIAVIGDGRTGKTSMHICY